MSLQFIVRHGDDGQDQVDKVKRSEENVGHEEDDVPRAGRAEGDLIKILPKVLSHQPEGAEVGLGEGVKTRVAIVRIGSEPLDAGGAERTFSGSRRVSAHDVLPGVGAHVPGGLVQGPVGPALV